MRAPSLPDRRFPMVLAFLILIGTARLLLETSSSPCARVGVLRRLYRAIFGAQDVKHKIGLDSGINGKCNLVEGRWVSDRDSGPLYEEESCPYLTQQVTCRRNGRPDSLYQSWRWKPHKCDLPRFDAVKLLERLRDKRLMFIGDSIQRIQWESMVCLLQSVIPDNKKSLHRDPPMKIFKAEEFNASIEFYWAPFMVESNADHATKHRVQKRLVRLDSIAKHSRHWEGVQALVFESYVWWMNKPVINATINGSSGVQEFDVPKAYRLALSTWADWIRFNIDSETQRVFFMSMSPTHLWSWEWKPESDDGNCFNETSPIRRSSYWGSGSNLDVMGALKDVLEELKPKVTLLNITQLSEYRKDGHTSVYTERRGELLTSEQRSNPRVYADCIHWCLPGVPDTWNLILYAYLMDDTFKRIL